MDPQLAQNRATLGSHEKSKPRILLTSVTGYIQPNKTPSCGATEEWDLSALIWGEPR